ncbi:unnamed protein product [Caenorhabditis auriculariae]|uniref:Uncharacterized protein n=1 Tax=Caenorhabditis auriculariae TaxID=2777116 RepID=A0A8S1HU96_9PELO|nr:unnamed protein product [Caenorhabditis auriculariae]
MDDSGPNEELEQVVQAVIANDLQVTPQICEVLKKNKGEGLKKLVAKEIAQCFSLRTRAVLTMLWCALEAPNVINFRSMKMEPKEQEKSDDEIEVIYFRSMKMEPMEQEKRNDEIKVRYQLPVDENGAQRAGKKRDYEVNEEFLKNLMPYDEELQEKIKKDKEYDYRRASLTLAFYDTRDASRDGTFQEQIELILVNFYDQLIRGNQKIPAFVHISENVKEYLRETLPLMTIRVNNGKRRRTAGPFPRSRTEAVIRHPM